VWWPPYILHPRKAHCALATLESQSEESQAKENPAKYSKEWRVKQKSQGRENPAKDSEGWKIKLKPLVKVKKRLELL
jgi:hypothetical protein